MPVTSEEINSIKNQVNILLNDANQDSVRPKPLRDDLIEDINTALLRLKDLSLISEIRAKFYFWIRKALSKAPEAVPTVASVCKMINKIQTSYEVNRFTTTDVGNQCHDAEVSVLGNKPTTRSRI
ncbi:uncharacterized protein BT62DRAFT_1012426 [Guyanagaster necrorhizus]|uniref:Uncharacterized protein n=1 Tax=Guyanagaster necrorhizus TaxID=856835 RepID=A0A9P7VHH8_9AGAR|nr:uncharacterized protein BT62DRAFT_1012426 [Guyanagaster necrorhizus MCA 3950]KAG7440650.1 hypothetical protein BT62DRAFT_1012426 [Guyanagaster necrorhizus MCA 3950]